MYKYKLTEIVFNDGTTFNPGRFTVIVGPNNSGKSRCLKDIAALATNPRLPVVVVKSIQWTMPRNLQELFESYRIVEPHPTIPGANWNVEDINYQLTESRSVGHQANWRPKYEAKIQSVDMEWFANTYGPHLFAFLTTEHRLSLVNESESPASDKQRARLLHIIYADGRPLEIKIRQLVQEAFGRDIILDYASLRRLRLRVGADFTSIPLDPREAMPILALHETLDDQGDGIRSFVGVVVAVLSTNRSLLLIDEPETFLHPPQAFRIGGFLADQSSDDRQFVVATHSADVLRGILARTQNVSILRLDRIDNKNNFRVLDSKRVIELVNDPLLSSARVLDGLFYSGAVVVESDSDAKFYQAVSKKHRRDVDLHFVNADNKQTVPKITQMYREMGVRCAGIVDFDVLNDRSEFQKQLESLALDKMKRDEAADIREKIAEVAKERPVEDKLKYVKNEMTELLRAISEMETHGSNSEPETSLARAKCLRLVENKCRELADISRSWKELKQKGRTGLPPELQSSFDRLWAICAGNGLFINPCGELESMLTDYSTPYTTDKRSWIQRALQLVPNLIVSDEKHPWKFIKAIHEHIAKTEG